MLPLIGYARVSTGRQSAEAQIEELRKAGCEEIIEETASGARKSRPKLTRLLAGLKPGSTLVVVRIDRIARSLTNLLEIVEVIEKRGAAFRSLHNPIDTTNSQGRFMLQVLGAGAELERSLLVERTLSGLEAARAKGRVGGNPALKRRDPEAIQKLSDIRRAGYLSGIVESMETWFPMVQEMRPHHSWGEVARSLNEQNGSTAWNVNRLIRAVRALVKEGIADAHLLTPTQIKPRGSKSPEYVLHIISGLLRKKPDITVRELKSRLEDMDVQTPGGKNIWSTGTVFNLMKQARDAMSEHA